MLLAAARLRRLAGLFSSHSPSWALVLLNLLIAILGDSFDKVQDAHAIAWRLEQARSIADEQVHMTEGDRASGDLFPSWLFVLKAEAVQSGADEVIMTTEEEWQGPLRALKRRIETLDKRIANSLAEQSSMLSNMIMRGAGKD